MKILSLTLLVFLLFSSSLLASNQNTPDGSYRGVPLSTLAEFFMETSHLTEIHWVKIDTGFKLVGNEYDKETDTIEQVIMEFSEDKLLSVYTSTRRIIVYTEEVDELLRRLHHQYVLYNELGPLA